MLFQLFQSALTLVIGAGIFYFAFLAALTIPSLQDHVIYLHRVRLTWLQDINSPEQWGFLYNQVKPFHLTTPDGETLHAWHILPLDTYEKHELELRKEAAGLCHNITRDSHGFRLLRDDPDARVVIYLHGAAGTLGSGWRPQSYRAISAATTNAHILAIDYRGFGRSTGWPSEAGLLIDALTLAHFVLDTAGIPPDRVVVFGQSLGTAVGIALINHLAAQSPAIYFSGMVLVAPFADVELLTRTYRVAGTIPLLSPLAALPPSVLRYFNTFIVSKWSSKHKLAEFIRRCEQDFLGSTNNTKKRYDITVIHAQDDYDIPWVHSEVLFWHVVNATSSMSQDDVVTLDNVEIIEQHNSALANRDVVDVDMDTADIHGYSRVRTSNLGAGGREMEWQGRHGTLRTQIVKYGLHDRIMSYPIVSLAIARAFSGTDS